MGRGQFPNVIRPRSAPRRPLVHGLQGAGQRQPGMAALFGSGTSIVGTPDYKLLLRFNNGDGSDVIDDDGTNGYTVTYFTNDPVNSQAQTSDQVLFGVSSFEAFRGGGTPGHGGRDTRLNWTAGTGMDWGSNPDVLIGGPIWPTYTSGDDDHCFMMLRRVVGHNWKINYTDAGAVSYVSKEGGVNKCSITGSIALVYGEWNWLFLSLHGGTAALWIGTDANGYVELAASGADTSSYDMGSLGATSGSISEDAISSGGRMNCYLDHIYAATGAYISGTGQLAVPTSEP